MAFKRTSSKGKTINPHYWVFCEGETEEAYVSLLRSKYRIPIDIVPKIVGNRITDKFIRNYKQNKPTHKKDKDFLIYDADIPEVIEKLKIIPNAIFLFSAFFRDTLVSYCKSVILYYLWVSRKILSCSFVQRKIPQEVLVFR